MILYLGSSSLIKIYANEPDSAILLEWVKTAEIVVTCRIAYTEIISALDIRYKKGDLSKHDYDLVLKQFSQDWQNIVRLDFDDYETGMLVKKYGLTRFGALHLSAAMLVASEHQRFGAGTDSARKKNAKVSFFFSSADQELCKAAESEGLNVLPLRSF